MDSNILVAIISAVKDMLIACIKLFKRKDGRTSAPNRGPEKMDIPSLTVTKTVPIDKNEISNRFLPGVDQLEKCSIKSKDYLINVGTYLAADRPSSDLSVFQEAENNELQ